MRKGQHMGPHVDIDTLSDALAVAMHHMYVTGALEMNEDAVELLVQRAACYEADDLMDLFEAAAKIMARSRAVH
jgi:hypothetical protein